jgi:nucleoside-diphosphate-sugar epimerase
MHLVIGGRGLIGAAVVAELERRKLHYFFTTRNQGRLWDKEIFLDLEMVSNSYNVKNNYLPNLDGLGDVLYLIAGMPGLYPCEGNATTFRVNADASIALARRYKTSFVVLISSMAVENAGIVNYARAKAHVENYINTIDGAIIRPGPAKVTAETAASLAGVVVHVGMNRISGVTHWPSLAHE